ncbi:MAG: serine hydrolase domain-containing protein, partial [Bacteroidota bacterium]
MNLLRKMLMLCFLPLGAGTFFFFGSCNIIFHPPNWDAYDRFEFTVWGDTARDGNLGNIRTVQLSEREMIRASLLVLQNQDSVLPFSDLAHRSFFQLTIGEPLPRFAEYLRLYTQVEDTTIASVAGLEIAPFTAHSPLIVALNGKPENLYVLSQFLQRLQAETEVVLVNFGDYEYLRPVADFSTIVQVPNRQKLSQELAAQLLFGGIGTQRSIPEAIASGLKLAHHYPIPQTRLAYSEPEYLGFRSDSLAQIDAIVAEAIQAYALPGCQVLVAKSNQVIFHKAYGYHTYERKRPVRKDDLYDLASLTKVAATTLASMELYEAEQLQLDAPLGTYFQNQTFIPQPYRVYDSLPAIQVQDDSLGTSLT